ncbi:acyltransferase [Clostridium gasigenes]|uniref:acyltransferase n=1 Tax=Clostridium gasigenes TaxID=94869 RepID=UPI001C0C24D7|nr:acyltransferase family protein [Clostridium gasigenes]MBU3103161.1 acyltransferase family protein [Clostridium gasigenes]
MKRNISLELLKIIACFSVITLHVVGIELSLFNSVLYYLAGCAVPIFFMVNGNLLLNKENISCKYVFKKIINILYVVFLWNVVINVLFLTQGHLKNPFIESIKSLLQRGYFWQFWFFGALIIIYCCLPIIFKLFKHKRKATMITLFFVGSSITIDLISLIRSSLGFSIVQIHFIQTFRIWTWFAYFLLGGIIGKLEVKNYIMKNITTKKNMVYLIITTITTVIYQYNISRYVYKVLYAEFFYDNVFTFVWILSLFLFIYRLNIKNIKLIKLIEIVSYNTIGIYIIHVTLIQVIDDFYNFSRPVINIIMVLIIFLLSMGISIIISKIPFIKKLIKL